MTLIALVVLEHLLDGVVLAAQQQARIPVQQPAVTESVQDLKLVIILIALAVLELPQDGVVRAVQQ